MKKGQIAWSQIVAIVIAVAIIVVSILIYTGKVGQSTKDITRCGGLLAFGKHKGECLADCPLGTIESATFSSDCPEGQKCCIIERESEI